MPTWTSPNPSSTRASPLVVFAAKAGRGGKGGESGAPKRQAAPGNPPAAPRITGKVGRMSVHTQIKLVERYKSLSGGAGAKTTTKTKGGSAVNNKGTVEKSAFRKTKDDAYQEELARRRAAKRAEARHLETLKSFRGVGAPPTLIVDGYNVCGCDEGAKAGLGLKEAFAAGDLETARARLVDELDTLGAHKGYRIVCVFDADRTASERGGGSSRAIDAAERAKGGTWVVFSVTNDADSWIERASIEELAGESSVDKVLRETRQANGGRVTSETERAARRDDDDAAAAAALSGAGDVSDDAARRRGASRGAPADEDSRLGAEAKKNPPSSPPRVVYVATSDNALSSVVRGNGAYAVSAGSLVEELTRARADETEILRELSVKARWGGEKRGLAMVAKDASTADKLMEMYKSAPNTSAVEKFGSRTGGFSSKPKKGKKNKGKK